MFKELMLKRKIKKLAKKVKKIDETIKCKVFMQMLKEKRYLIKEVEKILEQMEQKIPTQSYFISSNVDRIKSIYMLYENEEV